MSSSPHVFVLGCPRSGTTFVAGLLNAHPALRVSFWEGQFLYALLRIARGGGPADAEPERELELDQTLVWHGIGVPRRLGAAPLPSAAVGVVMDAWRSGRTPAERRDRAAAAYWAARGPGAGDKVPDYTFVADDLRDLHPGAYRLWVLRNPSDTAASILAMARRWHVAFCPPDPRCAALVWLRREEQRLRYEPRPDRDRSVDYDALCGTPAERSRDLLRSVGLEPTPETDAFVASRYRQPRHRGAADPFEEEFVERVRDSGLPEDASADLLTVEAQYAPDPLPLLERAVEREPGNFRARAARAEAFWRSGNPDGAAREAESAVSIGSGDPVLRQAAGKSALLRAWAARIGGSPAGAAAWARRALELFPEYGLARRYLTEVLKVRG